MNKTDLPMMLNIKDTAEMAGLAVHHVRQLVKQNKVAYITSGRKVLINFDSMVDYLHVGDSVGTQSQRESQQHLKESVVGKVRRLG